ncbi:MAG: hypothetical protein R3C52_14760 [Hyphomonadaceae bacterium]
MGKPAARRTWKRAASLAAAIAIAAATLAAAGCARRVEAEAPAPAPYVVAGNELDIGRYLVRVGGCNDCHTPGYAEAGGAMPESEWLTGSPVGFAGPWGVSYASNLRLSLAGMEEDDFVQLAHDGQGRPPMPWPSLTAMSDSDLRALYRYVRILGPKGKATPAPLSPGDTIDGPVVNFVPVTPNEQAR